MIKDKVLLGIEPNGNEYYLCPPSKLQKADENHPEPWREHPTPWIAWRFPDIRDGFRARPGYKLIGADYSQAEIKLMAEMSGDPWLTEALNSGKDIHCYTAAGVYKNEIDITGFADAYEAMYYAYKHDDSPYHDDYSKKRSNVKTTTFGVPYGAGPGRIAEMTGLDFDVAEALINVFFSNARVLKAWLDKQFALAITKGYTESIGGRKRFYDLYDEERLAFFARHDRSKRYREMKEAKEELEFRIRRCAGNQPIQTSCVDLLKPAMIRIYLALRGGRWEGPLLYDAHIVLSVHDEIVIEAIESQAEEVKVIVERCMQESYDEIVHNIINKVDVTIADYWKK